MGLLDQFIQNNPNFGGGQQQQPSYTPQTGIPAPGQPFSWNNFIEYQQAIQQANQQFQQPSMFGYPWQQQQQQQSQQQQYDPRQPYMQAEQNRQQDDRKYREMTDLEKFSKGAQDLSDTLSTGLGNLFIGERDRELDPYAVDADNVARTLINLPGMVVGSIPDIVHNVTELAADAPVKEADSETGMIEDRRLSVQENTGDVGYTVLGALGFVPGLGPEARISGAAAKGAGAIAKAGSKALNTSGKFADAALEAGTAGLKNRVGSGVLTRYGENLGKVGADLNPYRWGDAALDTVNTAFFEGAQEAGQTGFEELRNNTINEDTAGHMLGAGALGALGGAVFGGVANTAGTLHTNSVAKKEDAHVEAVTDYIKQNPESNYFEYLSKNPEDMKYAVSPEVNKRLLELHANDDANYVDGTSFKGVAGSRGQSPLFVDFGARGIKREWEANKNGDTREKLAKLFGYSDEDFGKLMQLSPQEISTELTKTTEARYSAGDPTKYIYVGEKEDPATNQNFKQTFIVRNITPGNTIQFAPGLAPNQNSDLDGDIYQLITDKDFTSWDFLPTRRLMTQKAGVSTDKNGNPVSLQAVGYGDPTYGFAESGITDLIGGFDAVAGKHGATTVTDGVKKAIDSILESHGMEGREKAYWRSRLLGYDGSKGNDKLGKGKDELGSFIVSQDEKDKLGITWKHKFAKTLTDMVNDKTIRNRGILAGDELVSDIITTLSVEGGILSEIDKAGKAFNSAVPQTSTPSLMGIVNGASNEGVIEQRGELPPGKSAPVQFAQTWGRVNYALTKSDNPFFRFKQMGSWGSKYVPMVKNLQEFQKEFNLYVPDDVKLQAKWVMQMYNDANLPQDYIETAFKARVLNDVMNKLGIGGEATAKKFGNGLTLSQLQEAVTKAWNECAEAYDSAMTKYMTSKGLEPIDFSFHKTRVDVKNGPSFYRAARDLFEKWDVSQLAVLDDNSIAQGMTLGGLVDMLESNPVNYDRTMFASIPDFNVFIEGMRNDYQGKLAAQVENLVDMLSMCEELRANVTVDEDGNYIWDAQHDLEMGFWHGMLLNTIGVDAAMYLGIPGVKWLTHSNWAPYLLSGDLDTVKRALVAMGIRYNWRHYIDLRRQDATYEQAAAYAFKYIDFSNPLNQYIWTQMLAAGYRETGIKGTWSDKPLELFTDPDNSKLSYEGFSTSFEQLNTSSRVRQNSDMLLYFALDDGNSVPGVSDLTTRRRDVKQYRNAIERSTTARAAEHWKAIKELISAANGKTPETIVEALRKMASTTYDTINVNSYAAGLHDAAYFQHDAADKANAGRGVSLHAQAVLWMDGGFTTSFLNQLGASVGAISASDQFKIAAAIRRAIFDPSYYQDVCIGNSAEYITISQAEIFSAAGIKISENENVGFPQINALFEAVPQLLGYILPHTLEPLSAQADTVTAVMKNDPKKMVEEIIENNGNPAWERDRQIDRAENIMLADQDSSILTIGNIDDEYDNLLADSRRWTDAIRSASRQWSEFLYDVATISDDVDRQTVLNRCFGTTKSYAFEETIDIIERMHETLTWRSQNALSDSIENDMSDSLVNANFRTELEKLCPSLKNISSKTDSDIASSINATVEKNLADFEEALDAEKALLSMGLNVIMGREIDAFIGKITPEEYARARRIMWDEKDPTTREPIWRGEKADENDKASWKQIDKKLNEAYGRAMFISDEAKNDASKTLIHDNDVNFMSQDFSPESMISKIRAFVESGRYYRLPGDYGDLDKVEEEIREKVKDLKTSTDQDEKFTALGFLEEQALFWNQEILNASLQRINQTIGKNTGADQFKRLREARDFVEDKIEEIRNSEGFRNQNKSLDPDDITMPRLSFKNPATSMHIEMAGIELETGLAPIASGQNAGAYQYLGVLDFIGSNFSCNAPLHTGLTLEEAIDLAESQDDPLNIVGEKGVGQVTAEELRNGKWTDDEIANMQFAPQKDCTTAICHNHNPIPMYKTDGDYIGGRYTIAALCWFLSEKKVFKAKKKRRVFNSIAHAIHQNEELKHYTFDGRTREELLAQVIDYQEKLTTVIADVFKEEHMEGDFSENDARIIATFMTPALEFSYKGQDGKIHYETFSKQLLHDQDKFDSVFVETIENEDGTITKTPISIDSIESVRPLCMSVIDICKKLSNDLVKRIGEETQTNEKWNIPIEKINQYVEESFEDWGGKHQSSLDLRDFLHSLPVVRRGTSGSVLFGSSPNSMQNFLIATGALQRGDARDIRSMINLSPSNSMADRAVVAEFNEELRKSGALQQQGAAFGGKQVVLVGSYLGEDERNSLAGDRVFARDFSPLNKVSKTFRVASPSAINAVILPEIRDNKNTSVAKQAFEDAFSTGRVVLVPSDFESRKAFESVNREASNCLLASNGEVATVTIGNKEFFVYDPYANAMFDTDNVLPQTYVEVFNPYDVALTFADYYRMALGDSGFKVSQDFADQTMHFDEFDDMSMSVLAGKGSNKAKIMSLVPYLSGRLDDTKTQDIKNELKKAVDGENSRFILPDFDDTYRVEPDVIQRAVERYLNTSDDNLHESGVVRNNVSSGDCFGIVCVKDGSLEYYMPLIFNTGGSTMTMSTVFMSDADLRQGNIRVYWTGDISHKSTEGIKIIFPNFAYKAYTNLMDDEDMKNIIQPGFDIPLYSARQNGSRDMFSTYGMYSAQTADSRFIDVGLASNVETLGTLSLILPHDYFRTKDNNNKWNLDYGSFRKRGINITEKQYDEIATQGWTNFRVWNDFINGVFDLHEDPFVNAAMRIVAKTAIASRISPMYCFSNIHDSKIQYAKYNVVQIFSSLDGEQLERFFFALDPSFCFNGIKDRPADGRPGVQPIVDHEGRIRANDGTYREGHIHFLRPTNDSTMLGVPSNHTKWGSQVAINYGLMEGMEGLYKSRDIHNVIDYINARTGNPRAYTIGGKNASVKFDGKTQREIEKMLADTKDSGYLPDVNDYSTDSIYSRRYLDRVAKIRKEQAVNMSRKITFYDSDGNEINLDDNPSTKNAINSALDKLRNAFKMPRPLSSLEIYQLFKQTSAHTWNDGNGSAKITVKMFTDWVNTVCDRLDRGEYPFGAANGEGRITSGRPVLPCITQTLLRRLATSTNLMNRKGQTWTYEMLEKEMDKRLDDVLRTLKFSDAAQREAVYTMIDYINGTYNKKWMHRSLGDLGVRLDDLINSTDPVLEALGYAEGVSYKEAQEATRNRITIAMNRNIRLSHRKMRGLSGGDVDPRDGLPATRKFNLYNSRGGRVARSMAAQSQILATLNPAIAVGSVVVRYKAQGLNKAFLFQQRLSHNGRVQGNPGIELNDRKAVKDAAADPKIQLIWRAFNTLNWTNEDITQLQNAGSFEAIEELLKERLNNMTKAEKAANWWFEHVASGGRLGINWQIENFLDRFASTTTEETEPWYTKVIPDELGNKTTTLERLISESPDNLFLDLLTTRNDNPSYVHAMQARNWVLSGEYAAQSMFGNVLVDLFSRHPFAQALCTCGFMRFPLYAYNVTGWFLNHVAPVSTVSYIFRNLAIKAAREGNGRVSEYLTAIGVENTQIYTSLKEALIADAMVMGPVMLAGMLFAIGAIEPPDDEYYDEYAGQPSEWTVAGFRLKDAWWLMDVLGPFGAVAATWKSIEIGKPRFDLMQNWMTQALWSNPVLKASDVARSMLDPSEQYLEQYDNIVDQYQKIQGGPPDMLNSWLSGSVSLGLNFAGQFVTPSFIREMFNSTQLQPYERSYKKIKNEDGEIEYTDYLDSQIRKVTRKNVVLGLIMDAATVPMRNGSSGYTAYEMPKVVVPDESQRGSMEYFSMYNPDGTERTEAEKQAKAFEALIWLNSTDDIKTLTDNGFILPLETRIYMSQMLNDLKQYEQDMYSAFVKETGKNAYYLGNGDFTEGQRILQEINDSFYGDLRSINALYDKVWSDEMRKGMQFYYRENTPYARTASGEWYATGIRTSVIPPFPVNFAPGTREYNGLIIHNKDNPDGTMGHEGNWETPSEVVAGASAGGRALIPIPDDLGERPKLEDFGNDKNGGYSDTEAGKAYSELSKAIDASTTSRAGDAYTGYLPYGYRSYGSRAGGNGGGGGYRSSGRSSYPLSVSAPRGYTPSANLSMRATSANIGANDVFAPSLNASPRINLSTSSAPRMSIPDLNLTGMNMPAINLNIRSNVPNVGLSKPVNSRTMNTANLVKAQDVNLRPGFETKGSRDAYRRSDI